MNGVSRLIRVEILEAFPDHVWRLVLQLPAGASVADALATPQVLDHCPDIATRNVGIFSKACGRERVLRDGDRIELYRPLLVDPKEARRERAEAAAQKSF